MQTEILDAIENGILITNRQLEILFWNKWLALHTGIPKDAAAEKTLDTLFAKSSFDLLKQKIRIALRMKSPTFTSATNLKYLIPIEQHKITKSIFRHMRQDVVIKPLDQEQVCIIIYDVSALLEARAVIDDQLKMLEKQAKTDGLTGCHNKSMFNEMLSAEIKRSNRHQHIFSVVIFDIDDFKKVNDTYGHLAGDGVLRDLAGITGRIIRQSDTLARWGGEEFCLLLPETSLDGAAVLADKIRLAIARHDFGSPGYQHCSFGVAQFTPGIDEDTIVSNADKALYFAKRHGKNQVSIFEKESPASWRPSISHQQRLPSPAPPSV